MCVLDGYVHATTAIESVSDAVCSGFVAFVRDLGNKDNTWKFWCDFLFHDCMAYSGLYLAICGGIWTL